MKLSSRPFEPGFARASILFASSILGCGDDLPAADDGTGTTEASTSPESGSDGASAMPSTSAETVDDTTAAASSSTAADDTSADGSTGAPDSGLELLVCSFTADAVHRFDVDTGEFLGNLGETDDLDGALGITLGPDGQIYVASEESNMVLRYDGATGAFVDRFVADDPKTPEDETGGLSGPGAVLFGPDGQLYVSSFDSDAILRYDGATGAFVDVFVAIGDGGIDGPDAGTVFGPDGNLYVPGYYSNTIPYYDGATGMALGDFTPTDMLAEPRTLVFEGDHLYVANEGTDEVLRFDAATGDFVDVFVAAGEGGLNAPAGMVFGPDGVLHVASVNTNTVLRFDAGGQMLETLIDGTAAGIDAPTHIALVPALR